MNTQYDLIVLGGGPAGLAVATLQARQGQTVALIDNSDPHAEKVGESVPASFNPLLKKLGLPELTDEHHCRIAGSDAYWSGGRVKYDFMLHLNGSDWRLNRRQFEKDLLDAAILSGVEVVSTQATQLGKSDAINGSHIWCVSTTSRSLPYISQFIIDASGRSGLIARKLNVKKYKSEPLIALWASVEISEERYQYLSSETLIETQHNGWWYAAKLPNRKLMFVFHTDSSFAVRAAHNHSLWFESLLETNLISKTFPVSLLKNTLVNTHNARSSVLDTPFGSSWAACGDAAIGFDPVSSQGIYNAIATAGMLDKALNSPDRTRALEHYGDTLKQVAKVYMQKRIALYEQAKRFYQTEFWINQCRYEKRRDSDSENQSAISNPEAATA
ncbi:NAD(P)/FAD-dependent oxidoreductase [Marinomonas mediterranea]|uniref:NAD(P)/FAD-dependent oxidoreductase n=1 Tax=Marinomonas mediterranea TaxID=119864 RepID=UPI00234B66E5|nr:FAD-dependent monooxygenase [Marinomonas mediterranea]WCN09592.1 hypothetical protein GV055_11990 [Marinomonas mediterranea]